MKYRKLGSTGLDVSKFVFGAGAVGGIVFQPDRETRLEAVRRALGAGVNWIDTAPGYGDGQSEENLGRILKEVDEKPYISTKVRIGAEHLADIPGEIQRSMEASLERLQRDSVDLIQLHTAVTRERGTQRGSVSIDNVLDDGGVLTGFDRLRDQGLANLFGFTGFGETECLHGLIKSGRFNSVQTYYNLLNPSVGRSVPSTFSAHDYGNLIALAHENGVGILNIRVLAAGAVAGQDPAGGPARASRPARARTTTCGALARSPRRCPGTRARWRKRRVRDSLTNPGVSGVLVGFKVLSYVDEALAAIDMGPLADDTMTKLDKLYESDFGDI